MRTVTLQKVTKCKGGMKGEEVWLGLGTSLFCFFFYLFFFPAILLFFTYYAPYFAQEL